MDEEFELFCQIKYGLISSPKEFVVALPPEVVNDSIDQFDLNGVELMDYTTKKMYLRIMLKQPINKPKAEDAIWRSLKKFHSIQS